MLPLFLFTDGSSEVERATALKSSFLRTILSLIFFALLNILNVSSADALGGVFIRIWLAFTSYFDLLYASLTRESIVLLSTRYGFASSFLYFDSSFRTDAKVSISIFSASRTFSLKLINNSRYSSIVDSSAFSRFLLFLL